MYRLTFILIFTGILGLAITAYPQLNPNNLEHYSEMDGTIIYDIMPDRMGRIWIATQNGLACFDGYEFTRFFSIPGDPESISTILTYSLHEDMHGRIWIGGMESINRYDPSTKKFRRFDFLHLTDFPDYSQPGVINIIADTKGMIYFGINSALGYTASHALVYYDPDEDRIKRYESPDSLLIQNVYRTLKDSMGNPWLVCQNGLFKIETDGSLMKFNYTENLVPDKDFFNQLKDEDSSEILWIASNTELIYTFSPREGIFRSHSLRPLFGSKTGSLTTSDITLDPHGNVWIGTNQGLILYDRHANRFEMFQENPDNRFGQVPVNCLQFDSFGNLWIGTASNGLLKYNNQTAFRSLNGSLDSRSPVTPGWVINLHEAHDGKIWFSTLGDVADYSGINDLDPVSLAVTKYPYRSIMPGLEAIFSFIEYKPGEFYINSNLGFLKYYPGINKWEKLSFPGLPDTISVSKFFRDTRNHL